MACMIVAVLLGAAVVAVSVATVIVGFQWFTKYPFRWGWRAHAQPVGMQLPNGDPRLEMVPHRATSRLDRAFGVG